MKLIVDTIEDSAVILDSDLAIDELVTEENLFVAKSSKYFSSVLLDERAWGPIGA